jgi:hypothetical protein
VATSLLKSLFDELLTDTKLYLYRSPYVESPTENPSWTRSSGDEGHGEAEEGHSEDHGGDECARHRCGGYGAGGDREHECSSGEEVEEVSVAIFFSSTSARALTPLVTSTTEKKNFFSLNSIFFYFFNDTS